MNKIYTIRFRENRNPEWDYLEFFETKWDAEKYFEDNRLSSCGYKIEEIELYNDE